ncbi:conjugative transposon protein TraK [Parafilimonas sp.]|uniref:conjugative transposon protein TraK n=1 Tax=Parafilimonas sp. TaxID=1969739 RepID=UPI003F80E8D9
MFTKMKNIDIAFKHVRTFTFMVVGGCMLLCGFVLYKSYQLAAITESKVYVLANGKALEALAADRKDNIPVEARDHVKDFHIDFFTLDPDDKVIQSNIAKALYLADGSAKRQYEDLKENGYYSNVIAGNISQQITVDSVDVNVNRYPYYFKCYCTQKIIRTSSISYRSLITEGYLRNVSRSDNNPHGFLIERWNMLENKDLKTEAR